MLKRLEKYFDVYIEQKLGIRALLIALISFLERTEKATLNKVIDR